MTSNVLMLSPGYPAEMPLFTRALARVGARVIGLGDQPKEALPEVAREHVSHHVHVRSLWDEPAVVREIQERHDKGQPVLVGTISVEVSELLSDRLRKIGVPHTVLNAKPEHAER